MYKQIYIQEEKKKEIKREFVQKNVYKRISRVMFATEVGIVPVRLLLFSFLLQKFKHKIPPYIIIFINYGKKHLEN